MTNMLKKIVEKTQIDEKMETFTKELQAMKNRKMKIL